MRNGPKPGAGVADDADDQDYRSLIPRKVFNLLWLVGLKLPELED